MNISAGMACFLLTSIFVISSGDLKRIAHGISLFFLITLFIIFSLFNTPIFASEDNFLFFPSDIQTMWEPYNSFINRVENGYMDNGSATETLTIYGDTMTYQKTTYWGPDYSGGVYEINTWVYKATLGENLISSDGEPVQRVRLEAIDYYWQPFNQEEINDYGRNYERFCGFVPSPGDIIHESQCSLPSDTEVGLVNSGIFQLENNVLYINGNRDSNDYPEALYKNSFGVDKWYFSGGSGALFTYYRDDDDDGYGDPKSPYESVQQISGYVADDTDCNDYDSSVYPGATEIGGDGIDQNCDGSDQTTQQLVTEIYVATFGRAPANAGLNYWTNAVDTGDFSIEQVAQSFFDQPETQEKYPEGSSNSEFISTIFYNVLNRAPAEAGLNYWVDALNSGAVRRDQAIMAIINGAKAATGSSEDAAILAKKAEIGVYFAQSSVGDLTNNENFMDWATNIISFTASDDFNIEEAEDYISGLY